MGDCYNMKTRYYIEMKAIKSKNPYSMQSKWFESARKAVNWLKASFDFIDDSDIQIYLMSATFDENDDMVGDIEQEKHLLLGEHY